MNNPTIDNILPIENSEAEGFYLASLEHGAVKLKQMNIGHIMKKSIYRF